MGDTPASFAYWFYNTFISPLFRLLSGADVLGYSLLSWILGFSILGLAVRFFRSLFGADNNDRG